MDKMPAADVVRSYLGAMEARDLDRARGFLADGFTMTFPGDVTFATLEELIEWARPRYNFVKKNYDRFDEAPDDGVVIVYCYGTLQGELPDGTPFSNVRFIDRFTVAGDKLQDQQVWNDLAESLR